MIVARAALSLFSIGGWMTLLFAGQAWGGWVHAILVGALVIFPWRAANPTREPESDRP